MACIPQLLFPAIATNFMFVTICNSFLSTLSSSLSSSIAPSKSLDIPHTTTSLSSSSQDRTSSHSSFTASFGFVIFNTVKQTSFKSLRIYFTLFSTKVRSVHNYNLSLSYIPNIFFEMSSIPVSKFLLRFL